MIQLQLRRLKKHQKYIFLNYIDLSAEQCAKLLDYSRQPISCRWSISIPF